VVGAGSWITSSTGAESSLLSSRVSTLRRVWPIAPTDVREAITLVNAVAVHHELAGLLMDEQKKRKQPLTRKEAAAIVTRDAGADPPETILPLAAAAAASQEEIEWWASIIFMTSHRLLELRGEGFRPRTHAERADLVEIARQLDQARRVAERSSGGTRKPGRAKQLQLEASGGRPLRPCIGKTGTIRVDGEIRIGKAAGDGCGVIFADSTSNRWPSFAGYCPECRKKRHLRREQERAEQARKRGAGLGWRHDGRRWFHVKCSCGRYFFTSVPHRTSCKRCHDGHQKAAP
jgi:hypothetical protein